MSKHTIGKLSVRPTGMLLVDEGNVRFVAEMCAHTDLGVASPTREVGTQDMADAERLALCWNSMQGLDDAEIRIMAKRARHKVAAKCAAARDEGKWTDQRIGDEYRLSTVLVQELIAEFEAGLTSLVEDLRSRPPFGGFPGNSDKLGD